jgi:hypothetical protein
MSGNADRLQIIHSSLRRETMMIHLTAFHPGCPAAIGVAN